MTLAKQFKRSRTAVDVRALKSNTSHNTSRLLNCASPQAKLLADSIVQAKLWKSPTSHFKHYIMRDFGADGRTRTGTRLPPLAPQASASTNSATSAH